MVVVILLALPLRALWRCALYGRSRALVYLIFCWVLGSRANVLEGGRCNFFHTNSASDGAVLPANEGIAIISYSQRQSLQIIIKCGPCSVPVSVQLAKNPIKHAILIRLRGFISNMIDIARPLECSHVDQYYGEQCYVIFIIR